MNNVLEDIHQHETSRYGFWKMSGFALAAAIAGFVVLPNATILDDETTKSSDFNPKTLTSNGGRS